MLVERGDVYYTKDTNEPYSGPVFTLYGNGVKKSEIFLKDGEPDGLYTNWYKDGKIKQQGSYIDGKKHGKWTVWDTKGDGLGEFEYDHGQINGIYENDALRVVSTYEITTGGMENTFLIGEKIFVEKIKNNLNMLNEVVLFKHPRDTSSLYPIRVIAGPGDSLEIINKTVYINGDRYPFPHKSKFISRSQNPDYKDVNIFLGKGNKDNIVLTVIPKKDDIIELNPSNARLLLHLMVLDGHELSLVNGQQVYYFTMVSPDELYRRKGKMDVYNPYYPQGNKLVPWSNTFPKGKFLMDGNPIGNLTHYTVEQDYYWAMGDNRDDSLDSRYWGFVPKSHILGEALFSYFSLNLNTWIPRFNRIGTIIQ